MARADGRARRARADAPIARSSTSTPGFVEYFRAATPESELEDLTIASRPARRQAGGGVETLRAIPWVFAWTQTRLMLPSWLGVGEALDAAHTAGAADGAARDVRAVAVLPVHARSDRDGAGQGRRRHRRALRSRARAVRRSTTLGADLRARLPATSAASCDVAGRKELLDDNPVLRRSIDVRNPYVDPINLVQVELLHRLRQSGGDERLRNAFLVTVNGVAAGMRNTG